MLIRNEYEWEKSESGTHTALFVNYIPPVIEKGYLSFSGQKAPYVFFMGQGEMDINNITAYILGGEVWVSEATLIAIGGKIKLSSSIGPAIVYAIGSDVEIEFCASGGTVFYPPEEENIQGNIRMAKMKKIKAVQSFSVLQVVKNQKEWDEIPPNTLTVIVIKGDEKIKINKQKAPHIVQVSGETIVSAGVTLVAVGGSVECRGGTVIGCEYPGDEYPPLYVKIKSGKLYQYGGTLETFNFNNWKDIYIQKI